MNSKEHITVSNNGDYWVCPCGNNTMSDGFDTCNESGEYIVPTGLAWAGLYACLRCGRIIDQESYKVVSQTDDLTSFGVNFIKQ